MEYNLRTFEISVLIEEWQNNTNNGFGHVKLGRRKRNSNILEILDHN